MNEHSNLKKNTCTVIFTDTDALENTDKLANIISHCKHTIADEIQIRIKSEAKVGEAELRKAIAKLSILSKKQKLENITVLPSTSSPSESLFYRDLKCFRKILLTSDSSRTLGKIKEWMWDINTDILAGPVFTGVENPDSHKIYDTCDAEYAIIKPDRFYQVFRAIEKLYTFYHDLYNRKSFLPVSNREVSIGHLILSYKELSLSEILTYLAKKIDTHFKTADIESALRFSYGELPHILFNKYKITPAAAARHEKNNYKEWWRDKQLPLSIETVINIICTKHSAYIASCIQQAAKKNRIDCYIKCLEPGSSLKDLKADPLQRTIILSPNVFHDINIPFSAYQIEQSTSSRWFTDNYIEKLKLADYVLDYNIENIKFLVSRGLSPRKIYYAPVPQLIDDSTKKNDILFSEREIDVLFYGDCNSSRRRAIQEFLQESTDLTILFVSEVYDDDLLNLIFKSKVILNIHFYGDSLLESTRIREALSRQCVIVSETSPDSAGYQDLIDPVSWVRPGDLSAMALILSSLCLNMDTWQRALTAVKEYLGSSANTSQSKTFYWYQRFLSGIGMINLQDLENFPDLGVYNFISSRFFPNTINFVLSLPETPNRLEAYVDRNPFFYPLSVPFPAVKSDVGWIGCAMSYVSMARFLLSTSYSHMQVCEDDSIVPSIQNPQFSKVLQWLYANDASWDIYCGLVTNASPESFVLLHTKVIEGLRLVFFQGMTGTVHNIYNRKAAQLLSTWNPENGNIYEWSIDRFLERSNSLTCVTVLPFTSKQAEDESSTLWESHASNADLYSQMIKDSQVYIAESIRGHSSA